VEAAAIGSEEGGEKTETRRKGEQRPHQRAQRGAPDAQRLGFAEGW